MRALWSLLPLALVASAVVVIALDPPADAPGPAWDDRGPDGTGRLVDALALKADVRAIESSVTLLPHEATGGDVLFLFPTHRQLTVTERDALRDWLDAGGTLVIASDGGHAAAWAPQLGLRVHGIPVVAAEGLDGGCVPVRVPVGGGVEACLPSPSAHPDMSGDALAGQVDFVANASVPVFLDLDGDQDLGLGDQGPYNLPLVVSLRHGPGTLVFVADGDLWRNAVVEEHPANLQLAQALADGAQRIFVDSSGGVDGVGAWRASAVRSVSGPDAVQGWGVALLALAAAVAVAATPRHQPWSRHDPPADAEDETVQAEAEAAIQAAIARYQNPRDIEVRP